MDPTTNNRSIELFSLRSYLVFRSCIYIGKICTYKRYMQIHSIGCSFFFLLFYSVIGSIFFLGKDWADFNCNQLGEQTGITELCALSLSLYLTYPLVRIRI